MKSKNKSILLIVLSVFTLSVVFLTTCKKAPPEIYGDINGTVYEEGTTKTTGSDGTFEYKDLEAKEYELQATKSGFIANTKKITVSVGETIQADISLTAEKVKPTVSTTIPTPTSAVKATVTGSITNLGSGDLTAYGHIWSTSPAPTTALSTKIDYGERDETGIYTSTLTDLTPETEYFVRAFATNKDGTSYSNEVSFTTPVQSSAPIIETKSVTNITHNAATCGGDITSEGTESVLVRGVCWSTSQDPTISDNKTTDGTGTGVFVSEITGLSDNSTYHVRAYATNSIGTSYGSDVSFQTLTLAAPSALTQAATALTQTTATLNAEVNANGYDATVTFEYGTSSSYGISVNATPQTVTGSSNTNISANISSLAANTTYHFRVKVVNAGGTSYGSDLTFTTADILQPAATTYAATGLSQTTATLNGQVNANGNSTNVTFEYGTTTSYGNTVNASPGTVTGTSNTHVSTSLTGLTANTAYHYRVKAINSGGTATGDDMTFTTSTIPAPTAVTQTATNVEQTTATLNGEVNANNYFTTVTFEYGTTTSYGNTLNASPNTVSGNTNTSVSTNLTGLTTSTTYHYRVKAVNEGGTTTGSDMTFITNESSYITITAPTNGTDWMRYMQHDITWTDNINENVKIDLYKDGSFVETIIPSTLSDGIYKWGIASYFILGTDYQIKITSVVNSSITANSNNFVISNHGTVSDISGYI